MAHSPNICPDDRIGELLAALKTQGDSGSPQFDQLLGEYPQDPRLQFLKGSFLAARQDYAGAEASMRRAIELAPGYHLARFQLGLLLLTGGRPYEAEETWGPLHALPPEHYLRRLIGGLVHLIHDRFDDAVRDLQDGIARNQENPPMNRDMEMIIREIEVARSKASIGDSPASSVGLLLQQAALRAVKH